MNFLKTIFPFSLAGIMLFFSACTQEPELYSKPILTEPRLPEPFHFQKSIEIKPGLTFDILSWGRGADSVSSILILRSDSARAEYTSTLAKLEGQIADVWNMDMDADGSPEIFIQIKKENEPEKFILNVYEFDYNGGSQKLKFPDLTSATKKKYRGLDSIYIKDGKLRRQFPLFNEDRVDAKSIGKKVVEYGLSRNIFTISEPEERATE
jgi:hypothetical protein